MHCSPDPRRTISGNLSKQTSFLPNNQLPRIKGEFLNQQRLATLRWDDLRKMCIQGTYGSRLSHLQRNTIDDQIEELHPSILATKANAEDHPDWNTAMNGPFAAGFLKACQVEYDTLTEKVVGIIIIITEIYFKADV